MKSRLLGYYNYTVILTYIGMLVGFLGIVCVMEGNIETGVICLMVSGVCDMFDGAIASTKKRTDDEKCFGIQIDSLSDLICFGVLPAVVMLSANKGSDIAYAVASLYVLCALIRLAYFNVDEQNRQKETDESRKYYYGLPVTMSALFMPLVFALAEPKGKGNIAYIITLMIMGSLFLIPFKLKKPEFIGKIALGIFGILEFIFLITGLGDV